MSTMPAEDYSLSPPDLDEYLNAYIHLRTYLKPTVARLRLDVEQGQAEPDVLALYETAYAEYHQLCGIVTAWYEHSGWPLDESAKRLLELMHA